MTNLQLLLPEIALCGMALALLLCDLFVDSRHGRILYHLGWLAAVVALCLVGFSVSTPAASQGLGNLWSVDPLSQFFKILVLATTVLCFLLGLEYRDLPESQAGTFTSLMLFATAGLMFLVSAVDFLLIFVALELVSISSFILVGFERTHAKSNEGSLKYFLFGAFASAIMAYGISLLYGATGTTHLIGLKSALSSPSPMFLAGLLFVLIGFGFKASIAPMHFWVPDAYEGAPTPVTVYLSLAPKIATLGAMARVFTALLPASLLNLTLLLSFLSALTMTVGNFTAIFQNNVKRLLAYSSVAQAGYMLIAIVSGSVMGLEGLMVYSFVYIAMNLGAFAVAQAVASKSSLADPYDLEAFDGLSRRSFGMAVVMAFFLLSLAGIPPLAGFFGKFYIFSAAVQTGHYWLAAIGVVNSVASVYYYMRISYHMFFKPAADESAVTFGPYLASGLAIALLGVLFFGVYPEPLIAAAQASARLLP